MGRGDEGDANDAAAPPWGVSPASPLRSAAPSVTGWGCDLLSPTEEHGAGPGAASPPHVNLLFSACDGEPIYVARLGVQY